MRRVTVLSLAAMAVFIFPGNRSVAAQSTQYLGTTPCGDAVRAFVGGLPTADSCHAITWRVTVSDEGQWSAIATYGVPSASDSSVTVEGPTVNLEGSLDTSPEAYRLNKNEESALTLRRVSDGLIHFTTGDALMVGNEGGSYTLSRSDLTEQAGNPSAPDVSFPMSSRAEGNTVFGIFEGRTPCARIASALTVSAQTGCLKVKWRVTLFQQAETGQPSTYKIEGSLHPTQVREGTWQIEKGTPTNPRAVFYQLDAANGEQPLLLLRGDDKVLFFLDQEKQMLVGNLDFGYTLNRYSEK